MDESHLLAEISRILERNNGREEKAARVAEAIRRTGDYRWVGIYEVLEDEMVPERPFIPVSRSPRA